MNTYPKGSEWRIWDLHVHTPFSKGYSGDWEAFKAQVSSSEAAAIGINDYFSVEGYKKLISEVENNSFDPAGRHFFPVVEMRMTDSVQNKSASNGATHFNFHLIFNNDNTALDVEDIEAFIKSLSSDGSIIGSDYNDKDKRSDMKVSFSEVIKALDGDEKFRNNYLLWIPYDEYGGIDEIDPASDGWIKSNFIKQADILGSSNQKQIDFFLWKSPLDGDGNPKFSAEDFEGWFEFKKACIKGSDSHNAGYPIGRLMDHESKPTDKYCWIKADLTFEGLRQIVFEPENRIRIQGRKPEDKSSYQVIERISINSNDVFNQRIELNQNLNSIIGGRSTGKSVLLAAIAKKLKNDRKNLFDDYKHGYEDYISTISSAIEIRWADGNVNDEREIEFFEQSYMYRLARDPNKMDALIQEIISQRGADQILQALNGKKASIKKTISNAINDLFQAIALKSEKSLRLKELGDKQGVEAEIKKLVAEQVNFDGAKITDEDRKLYEAKKAAVEQIKERIRVSEKDKIKLVHIQEMSLIRETFEYEMTEMSILSRDAATNLLKALMAEVDLKWRKGITELILKLDNTIATDTSDFQNIMKEPTFQKVHQAYRESSQLNAIEQELVNQNKKLIEVQRLEAEISDLNKQINQYKSRILSLHASYHSETHDVLALLSNKQSTLHIIAKIKFDEIQHREILLGSINQQSASNKSIVNFKYTDNDEYQDHISAIFEGLVDNTIVLKGGYTPERLTDVLMSTCFYSISYDLAYENDNFHQMSDGKKAFVVLKLLLEFSEKQCPILIDQPEDDLDNRAIFLDLVQYIKAKKIERQIILATHNPNIVVGADTECVIVANQNGLKSENQDNRKFEYLTGSLEQTSAYDETCQYVLHSQGIREHVCAILEGGDTAFKLRERKYNIH